MHPPEAKKQLVPSRLPGLDALKVAAIAGIIVIHVWAVWASPTTQSLPNQIFVQLCSFAVPGFFMVSGYLFMCSWNSAKDKTAVIVRYGIRLMVPFFFWALFYAVVPPFISGQPDGISSAIKAHLWGILHYPRAFLFSGYVYHLWFLSSLFQALLILSVFLRYGKALHAVLLGGLLYGMELLYGFYSMTPFGLHTHYDMKEGPFVSTFFVALGALIAQRAYEMKPAEAILMAGAGYLFSLAEIEFLHLHYGRPLLSYNYTIGTAVFALGIMFLALAWKEGEAKWTRLGIYTLGIYVLHPYFIEVIKQLGPAGWLSSFPAILTGIVWGFSFLAAIGLARIPYLRRMVT